uniref:Ethylene-responsive transcription factor WRI1 n=1 Tax=Aegilops tauschii TaxID=37682 RepID=R7W5F8_AEGTA
MWKDDLLSLLLDSLAAAEERFHGNKHPWLLPSLAPFLYCGPLDPLLIQLTEGAYGGEEAAARAYDLRALKYWGHDTILDFLVPLPSYSSLSSYDQELKEMEEQSREEYIGSLRRYTNNCKF